MSDPPQRQLGLSFESPREIQRRELKRVTSRIGMTVMRFFVEHGPGHEFHVSDLASYVTRMCGGAPDSASRVMRSLRLGGFLDYRVIDRSQSLYRIEKKMEKTT